MSDVRPSDVVVAQRVGGATYQAIALLHEISVAKARHWCRRAMRRGQVTAEQIRHRPIQRKPRFTDEQYNERWLKRVMGMVIQDANGCWIFQGFKGHKGYGNTNYRRRNVAVHRKMFEITHSVKLKTEEFVCHSCDVRPCCNPSHLWKGDAKANNTDSRDKGTHYEARRTECERGHPLSGDNLYVSRDGARHCKSCQRGRMRVKNGWPVDAAFSMPVQPLGYTINPNRIQP